MIPIAKGKRLKVKGNTREGGSRIWERTKGIEPIETPLTTYAWLEGEVDRRKEERRKKPLLALLPRTRGPGKADTKETRKETGWIGACTHVRTW